MKRILVLLVLLLILCLPTLAQDATAVSTVEAMPVEIVTPPASSDPMIQMSVWQIVAGLAGAFSLGGLTIGMGVGVLASRLRTNPATMAAIEGLAASTPDSTVQQFTGLMDKFQYSLTEAFALVREALDKKPYGDKTPEERAAVLYPAQAAAADTGTGYTITGNQDGVTITADTSPVSGYASTSTLTPRMPDNG